MLGEICTALTLMAAIGPVRPCGDSTWCTIAVVTWQVWTLVLVLSFAYAVGSTLRDRRIIRAVYELLAQGRHHEVLDHPLPSRGNRPQVRAIQAVSAVLTGRYAVALVLLGPPGRRVSGHGTAIDSDLLRAAALVGLGRYGQATALLGDRPEPGELRRIRAQVAIEVGDDDLAEELLSVPDPDVMGEAGRRRILGQLRLRQGHTAGGRDLVRQAQSMYAGLDYEGKVVDEAYCSLVLERAALRAGQVDEALPLVERGLQGMQQRPDHAPGLAEAHALAAETRAGVGDSVGAEEHLRLARAQAALCASGALDAEMARAAWSRSGWVTRARQAGVCARLSGSTRRWARSLSWTSSTRHCPRSAPEPPHRAISRAPV
jgi:hypothetical protein